MTIAGTGRMVVDGRGGRNQREAEMAEKRSVLTILKDVALFFAAPFIALAYLALFPFIGIKLLLQYLSERKQAATH